MTAAEGWVHFLNATKWHYVREGRSLCRRWGYLGRAFEPEDVESPDNCRECWRRRQKEKEKETRP